MSSNNNIIRVSMSDSGYPSYYSHVLSTGKLVKSKTKDAMEFLVGKQYGCREEFYNYFLSSQLGKDNCHFLINILPKFDMEQYQAFLAAVEHTLGISNTIFATKTNLHDNYGVCLISINSWWLKSKVRLQFVTCLLRAFTYYKNANRGKPTLDFPLDNVPVNEILFSYSYLNNTKEATQRFMQGYTLMKKGFKCDGWMYAFSKRKTETIEKMLVKIDAGEDDANLTTSINPLELTGASVL